MQVPPDGPGAAGRGGGGGGADPAQAVRQRWRGPLLVGAGAAASLLAAALAEARRSAQAERETPPIGRFTRAGGAVLHHVDVGEGPPLVFLHGAGAMLQDWIISAVPGALLARHRVVLVDRPGHGYSTRPDAVEWTPQRQADALAALLRRLDIREAIIVAHSFAVLPALWMALAHRDLARGLVLLAGGYFPGTPVTRLAAGLPAPLLGRLVCRTLLPPLVRAAAPGHVTRLFAPAAPTRAFRTRFPRALAARPGQLHAAFEDARMIERATAELAPRYGAVQCPVVAVAGHGDVLFDARTHTLRLADAVADGRAFLVEGAGHMVHHSAPLAAVRAVAAVDAMATAAAISRATPAPSAASSPSA